MSASELSRSLSRRSFLEAAAKGGAAFGAAAAIAPSSLSLNRLLTGAGHSASKPGLLVNSNLTDAPAIKAMQECLNAYNAAKASTGHASLDIVSGPTFVAQLPTYLTESDPPNVILYWAGNASVEFGNERYLLNLSSIWDTAFAHDPSSLRKLVTDARQQQIFVPQSYYWFGFFYRKSMFKKWGIDTTPGTWSDFLALCEKLQKLGVYPLVTASGSPQPWPFVSYFDYLDLRINGAKFHLDLLHGKHSFNSPQVRAVFTELGKVMHYFDPASTSYQYQNAATPLVQGTAAMYLIGALILEVFPSDLLDDIDFFPFPTLHPAIPRAEEAPTNGFMAPRKVHNPAQTLDLLAFLGGDRAQEIYCEVAKGGAYPVSPTAHIPLTPLAVKGLDLLHNASALTQFFNRDSSDALQTTNYNAMEAFWENPANIDSILRTWQTAAQQVFAEQAKEGSLG